MGFTTYYDSLQAYKNLTGQPVAARKMTLIYAEAETTKSDGRASHFLLVGQILPYHGSNQQVLKQTPEVRDRISRVEKIKRIKRIN